MFASGIFLHLRHRAEHELVEQWHGECHVAMRRAENHPFLNKLGSYRAKAVDFHAECVGDLAAAARARSKTGHSNIAGPCLRKVVPCSYLTFKLFAYNLYVRLITQHVQLVPDAIKAIAVPPAHASILAANPDTRREINLTRLSPRDTSGKDCYNSSGPWRLIRCSVGKIVGKASDADGKIARISFGLGEVTDVKGN